MNAAVIFNTIFIFLSIKGQTTQPSCTNSTACPGEEAYLNFAINCQKPFKLQYSPLNSSEFKDVLICMKSEGITRCKEFIAPNYEFINCSQGSLFIKILNATKQHVHMLLQEPVVVTCSLVLFDNCSSHSNDTKNSLDTDADNSTSHSNDTKHTLGTYAVVGIVLGVIATILAICIVLGRIFKDKICSRVEGLKRSFHKETELKNKQGKKEGKPFITTSFQVENETKNDQENDENKDLSKSPS